MLEVKRMYQRIRNLREDRDLTQKNMGEILNCSQRAQTKFTPASVFTVIMNVVMSISLLTF